MKVKKKRISEEFIEKVKELHDEYRKSIKNSQKSQINEQPSNEDTSNDSKSYTAPVDDVRNNEDTELSNLNILKNQINELEIRNDKAEGSHKNKLESGKRILLDYLTVFPQKYNEVVKIVKEIQDACKNYGKVSNIAKINTLHKRLLDLETNCERRRNEIYKNKN